MSRTRRLTAPFRDRAGRFSALKTATLIGLCLPALWLGALAETGGLGARPINAAIHFVGGWTVRLLLLTLAVTPARALFDWPRVLLLRRMLGVATACYAVLHLTLYGLDQDWDVGVVASEILHRYYLTIGFVTLLGLTTLAITSTDGWQRRLGRDWKRLHQAVYPLAALALYHACLQSKLNVSTAIYHAGLLVWLFGWRLLPRPWRSRWIAIAVLAPLAAATTAAIEIAWYGLATRVPAGRVLAANLTFDPAMRPASQVLVATTLVLLAMLLRRAWTRPRPMGRSGGGRRVALAVELDHIVGATAGREGGAPAWGGH
jgi:sulfoxide reductase heme-binding subunit YedZ